MQDVLVTGGAGFLGSHLAERLLGKDVSVTIYDNFMRKEESERNIREVKENGKSKNLKVVRADVLDFETLKKTAEGKDLIFHLGALPSHRLALENPREYAMVDVIGTVNVLEAVRVSNSPARVIFASSNKVYGKQQVPFSEKMIPKPEGPYGLSKLCSEEFCRMYADYYGLNVPVVRYHHVIGPRCQPDRELSIFTEQVINNQSPIIHGRFDNGKFESCAADYTPLSDAIDATLLATKVKNFDVFNLATGKITTVLRIAELVMEYLGKMHIKPVFKEMKSHESLVHLADVSKAKKILGFEAKNSVENAVKQYIDWRLKVGRRVQAVYK